MYHRLIYRLGRTRWYSKVTKLNWKLISVHLEIVLILTQDRSMVCVKRTIGSEIVLDAPMELLGDMGHVEPHFFPYGKLAPFGDSANFDTR